MTYTPPPGNSPPPHDPVPPREPVNTRETHTTRETVRDGSSSGPSAIWFILGGLVVAIVLYFLFFTGTPEDATTAGETGAIEETVPDVATPDAPAATEAPAAPAPTAPAAPETPAAPATPAPEAPATGGTAPAN